RTVRTPAGIEDVGGAVMSPGCPDETSEKVGLLAVKGGAGPAAAQDADERTDSQCPALLDQPEPPLRAQSQPPGEAAGENGGALQGDAHPRRRPPVAEAHLVFSR